MRWQLLLLLSAAKLLQLQLVSKRWLGLLTSTEFRRMVSVAAREQNAAAVDGII